MPSEPTRIGVQVAPVAQDGGAEQGAQIGNYRIEAELGRGGMGIVYRAVHVLLERCVALKILNATFADDPDYRERFMFESRIAASMRHPNVVGVHDAGEVDGRLYLAAEHVAGSDLAATLSAGPLPRQRVVSMLEQVGSGLDAVHAEGLVHRDVKPGNILMQGDHAYLNDFGLAKTTGPNGPSRGRGGVITRAGDIVGTLDYMAPEQIEGKNVGPGTDIYALGCITYHCLTGTPPFVRDNDVAVMYAHMQQPPPSVTAARGDLPREVDDVVARAMAKRREDRYESCGEFVDALRDGLKLRAAAETGPLVLVATGEDAIRLLIHGALAVQGFRVVEEDDPSRLAERARELVPDLVIAQWAELGDLADDLFRQIRSDPRTTRARLIAIGPRAASPEMCTAMRDHVDDYLMRPFSPVHLLIKVGDLRAARGV